MHQVGSDASGGVSMAESWEVAAVVEGEAEAELACGYLDAAGIPCMLEPSHSTEFPTTVGALGAVRLRVPGDRVAEAQRLLAEQQTGGATSDDTMTGNMTPRDDEELP
jgi:hypothetical protein